MKMLRRFLLAAVLFFPLMGFAQEAETPALPDFDTFIAGMNAKCPIDYNEGWAIYSFVATDDMATVQLQIPYLLNGFLSALTTDTDPAKRLWMRQMRMGGEDWKTFVRLLVETNRSLTIQFMLNEEDQVAEMVFSPEFLRQ
jgi:hypothetical protein